MQFTRRALFGSLSALISAGATVFPAKPQERKRNMTPAAALDEKTLQAFLAVEAKYDTAPVPAPIDRSVAIAFVNANASRTISPKKTRKLVRLAVFYHLKETTQTFLSILTTNEEQPADIARAALCLVAVAWLGDTSQQVTAQRYFHALQDRAIAERDRAAMLEVVEALGPREGTAAHRQWIQRAIGVLEGQQRQAAANNNIPGAKLADEKINELTEYLNIELALVDRAFSRRQRIDAMPPAQQIQPLVAYSLQTLNETTPPLSYWASMRLLGLDAAQHSQIAAEFLTASAANQKDALIRARALRAAIYFGATISEPDHHWLETQPDTGVDALALRPAYYKR